MHWRILGTVLVELVPPPSSPAVGPDQLAFSDVPLPDMAMAKLESVSIFTHGLEHLSARILSSNNLTLRCFSIRG